jgi:Tol biopolymer transport system component
LLGNASQASVSSNGSLIYYPGVSVLNVVSTLKRVAHDGKPLASQDVKRGYSDPRVSPDGRLLAFHFTGENAPDNDIWVTELARGTLNRLTVKPLEDETPAWSPDGLWIAYAGYKSDTERAIYRVRADGSGSPELLWSSPDHSHVTDWSGDGNTLVLESLDANSRNDILVLTIGVDQTPRPYLKTQFRESSGRISPDGKWLAYQSDEAGPLEIYVQAFPNGGGKIPISIGGGTQPVWSRDGRELYFRSETAIMSVSIAAEGSGLKVGTPTVLFADTFARPQGATHTTFDVFADGSFMVLEPEQAAATQQQIVAVFNWFEELKQKVRAP